MGSCTSLGSNVQEPITKNSKNPSIDTHELTNGRYTRLPSLKTEKTQILNPAETNKKSKISDMNKKANSLRTNAKNQPEIINSISEILDKKERTQRKVSSTHLLRKEEIIADDSNLELDPDAILEGVPIATYKSLATSMMAEYALRSLDIENLPKPGTPESIYASVLRLKRLIRLIESDQLERNVLILNLHYTAKILENTYCEETKRLMENEDVDVLSEVAQDYVPEEVRDWLSSTFTRTSAASKTKDEVKTRFKQVANAIRAGIVVERIYRRMSSCGNLVVPPNVLLLLKMGLDSWTFDVFDINEASDNHALKFIGYELMHKYDIINKFKIDSTVLDNLLIQLEIGYSKNKNPYHNLIHAADVAQTSHVLMSITKLDDWLTDLEVFSTLFAAIIHDYEHTGTTNNFHIQTRSNLALTYNDRCVLENHHVSAVFKLAQDDTFNIFKNLTREQYRDFRNYVIEIVINTDMSLHFTQLKTMKSLITIPESIDKMKALSLLVHCADISHPAKAWPLHEKWTNGLCEEFFRQGDREKELSLPVSPLCDRNTVVVPQSQIGFIDFIVEPSFTVLGDMMQKILYPETDANATEESITELNKETFNVVDVEDEDLQDEESQVKKNNIPRPWIEHFKKNKGSWSQEAEKLQKLKEEN